MNTDMLKGVIKGFKPSYVYRTGIYGLRNDYKVRQYNHRREANIKIKDLVKRFSEMSIIGNDLILTTGNRKLKIKIDSIKRGE